MSEKKDGGSAFPHEVIARTSGMVCEGDRFTVDGMSLRDYFAGQALCGILGNPSVKARIGVGNEDENESISMCIYSIADAMIKERNK